MSIKPIIEKELAKMSRAERLFLAQYIIESLREEEGDDVSHEQLAELSRRSQSLRNGTAEFVSWEEIKSGLKK